MPPASPDQSPPRIVSDDTDGKHSRLLVSIIIGIALGTMIGGWLPGVAVKLSIIGEIFLNLLMMLVIPLVMLSMIVGITGLGDIRNLGSIGWRTLLYYMLTTAIAVAIGIIVVNVIQPGRGISPGERHPAFGYTVGGASNRTVTLTNDTWERTGYNDKYVLALSDQNVHGAIEAISENSVTVRLWERPEPGDLFYITADDGTRLPFRRVAGQLVSVEPELAPSGAGVEITLPMGRELVAAEGDLGATLRQILVGDEESGQQGLIPQNIFRAMARMEILPLIVFSLLLGAALSVLGPRVRSTIEVIAMLNGAVMRLVKWVMVIAPVGIFALIAARIGQAGGFSGFVPELLAIGKYSFSVLLGLALHGIVVLPLILRFVGHRNPATYVRGVGPALLNALSTSSSAATLPLTMEGVEEENGVSNRTASFVLPLGATINMDGTALYEAIAALFIAQVYGVSLSPAMQLVIFVTATLAAIGAAGIPEAGLVTMVIVLSAVGLPIEGVGLILAIDWLLDRFRTTVNVWGDSVGAGVIERFESRIEGT